MTDTLQAAPGQLSPPGTWTMERQHDLAVVAWRAVELVAARDAALAADNTITTEHHEQWIRLLQSAARRSPLLAAALDLVWFQLVGWESVEHVIRCAEWNPQDPVTRADVARMHGVHEQTVLAWIRRHPPGSDGGTPVPTGRDVKSGAITYLAGEWFRWQPVLSRRGPRPKGGA